MKTDIPVVFRIRDEEGQWIKPKIPQNSRVDLEGYWAKSLNGNFRLSFTATNYQIISNYCRTEKLSHESLCPFFISDKINQGIAQQTPKEKKASQIISQTLFNHYTEDHKSCQPTQCEILREKIRELAQSHE